MTTLKLIGAALIALFIAFGSGWVVGRRGQSALEETIVATTLRADGSEARARLLDGRVSLFLINFGDASRQFEQAAVTVERLQAAIRERGDAERAGRLTVVLAHIKDAQRLAALLDATAQNAAIDALAALGSVLNPSQ